jgi:hypothetical protein
MGSILVERHRLGRASIDFGTPALDLGIPGRRSISFRFTVEATNQLESQAGAFLGWKPENLREHIRGGHVVILADVDDRPGC